MPYGFAQASRSGSPIEWSMVISVRGGPPPKLQPSKCSLDLSRYLRPSTFYFAVVDRNSKVLRAALMLDAQFLSF